MPQKSSFRAVAAFGAAVCLAAACDDGTPEEAVDVEVAAVSMRSTPPGPSARADEPSDAVQTADEEQEAEAVDQESEVDQETEEEMSAQQNAGTQIEGRNRLGDETSPYLLQHRNNPVHWWRWGEDAFEAARVQNKPIFLSVGYSTCYWCHVMERESFENEAIADYLNEHFISIKLDREERPDIDDVYMTAVNILNQGHGGWPMSVFLEPQGLKPFLAGTYFPPEDRGGRPGFPTVLRMVNQFWETQREQVVEQADQVAELIEQNKAAQEPPHRLDRSVIDGAISALMRNCDTRYGGFGSAPKFPVPANLEFLIAAAWEEKPVRDAVLFTLDGMATGGIYDQIGGGFHRYSTDEKWLVPHFEKMLYDNGQLAEVYAAAYERTGDEYYAEIVRETLDYVLREMTAPEEGFYSAQDAEVNHREGQNYLWTEEQVREALSAAVGVHDAAGSPDVRRRGDTPARRGGAADDIDFALRIYGFSAGANFQDPHHPEDEPANVIHLIGTPSDISTQMGMPRDEFDQRVERINEALLEVRDQRDQPGTDTKILTGWNGLMIAGMATGGRILGDPKYTDAAREAARFVLESMRTKDGGLLRTYGQGKAKIDAFLEDYAYLIHGLIALHRATQEPEWLDHAAELAMNARERFWDESHGAYYDTLAGQEDLFVRIKSYYDGATPSGNAVMANNLVAMHELTGEEQYLQDAVRTLQGLSPYVARMPTATVGSLKVLDRVLRDHPSELESVQQSVTGPGQGPVTFSLSSTQVQLRSDESAIVDLTISIEEGYHINSHEPGMSELVPLEIAMRDGEGVEMTVHYPDGEEFRGPVGSMQVHHGSVTIPIELKRTGEMKESPRFTVTYQVCTDEVCLMPQTESMELRVLGE